MDTLEERIKHQDWSPSTTQSDLHIVKTLILLDRATRDKELREKIEKLKADNYYCDGVQLGYGMTQVVEALDEVLALLAESSK
jgi:hypothetical protein